MGILGGIAEGILERPLQERAQQDAFNFRKRQARYTHAFNTLDDIREEDLPLAIQALDELTQAKTPEKEDAAYGRFVSLLRTEDYGREQQTGEHNAAVGGQVGASSRPRIAMDEGMNAELSNPQGLITRPTNDYAQGGIRLKSSEGEMGRKLKFYEAQQEAQTKKALLVEQERRRTTLDKLRAQSEQLGIQGVKEGLDANGNMTITYFDKLTHQAHTVTVDGVTPVPKIISDARLAYQEERDKITLREHARQFDTNVRLDRQRLEQDSRFKEAQMEDIKQKALLAQTGANKDTTEREINSLFDQYKLQASTIIQGIEATYKNEQAINSNLMLTPRQALERIEQEKQKRQELEQKRLEIWNKTVEEADKLRKGKAEIKKKAGQITNAPKTPTTSTNKATTPQLDTPQLNKGEYRNIFKRLDEAIPKK